MEFTPASFEREVFSLLGLQGWQGEPEIQVGPKKVDAYLKRLDSFGRLQKLAVECKSSATAMTKEELVHICTDYMPLGESSDVDVLLIVTLSGLTPAAEAYVDALRTVRHRTYSELLNSIVDFEGYVRGLRSAFLQGDLQNRYIPQCAKGIEGELEKWLLAWVESDDDQPLAVLGGYGIGKTTLARRLAHLLANRHLEDPASRIPILIPLTDISTTADLVSLLGKEFTSLCVVRNYSYPLFFALNERERFVFLLDGFDEMKRTMSWDSLRYNLEQLNQLVVPGAKVVLLGRPTAFLSDEEQTEALHGRRLVRDVEKPIPGWPDYREIYLRPFSREQILDFVDKALIATEEAESGARERKLRSFIARLEMPEGRRLMDLAARPVQLKMLIEILPTYRGDIDNLTVAVLFEEFIDLVLRRELKKGSRQAFGVDARRRFASELAYWMWVSDSGVGVDSHEIPDSLFEDYMADTDDINAVKRDLLAGSILERKPPRGFYFPHRTFQEFLVADKLARMAKSGDMAIMECPYLTPEVTTFFVELLGKSDTMRWKKSLKPHSEEITGNCAELVKTVFSYYKIDPPLRLERDVPSATAVRQAIRQKRPLVRDILSSSRRNEVKDEEKRAARKRKTGPHRLTGVTPKSKFRT